VAADARPLPGDDVVPDASMVYDRARTIAAPPEEVWPWLVQLGKRRAGWYLPARAERLIPSGRRATWRLHTRWRGLKVGDRIPDYGGRDEELEVVRLDPPHALVYRSERRGATFSWALVLEPDGAGRTVVRLRFRGRLKSTGWRRRVIVAVGELFDWLTSELMLRGLAERVARVVRASSAME
jgi:uncharacterized protein YndB with AHSA1/START domain